MPVVFFTSWIHQQKQWFMKDEQEQVHEYAQVISS